MTEPSPTAPDVKLYETLALQQEKERQTEQRRVSVKRTRAAGLLAAVVVLLAIAAYFLFPRSTAPAPVGDVLATVNGVAVTSADLAEEARASGVSADRLDDATRKRLLGQVIDRRLLAGAAAEQGIDRDPGFLRARARQNEIFLASAIAQRLTGPAGPGGDAEARRFIAANPVMFADRQMLTLDTISVPFDGDPAAFFRNVDTMSDAMRVLDVAGYKYERRPRRIATTQLPAELATRLAKVPVGQVFIYPQGREILIGSVVERVASPLPAAEQLEQARAAAGSQAAQARLKAALSALRAKAKISYETGAEAGSR